MGPTLKLHVIEGGGATRCRISTGTCYNTCIIMSKGQNKWDNVFGTRTQYVGIFGPLATYVYGGPNMAG